MSWKLIAKAVKNATQRKHTKGKAGSAIKGSTPSKRERSAVGKESCLKGEEM